MLVQIHFYVLIGWVAVRLAGFLMTLYLWQKERKRFFLMFSLSWFGMASMGLLRLGGVADGVVLREVAAIFMLPMSAITGALGLYQLTLHTRKRITTMRSVDSEGTAVVVRPYEDTPTPRFRNPP